ncbi:MAG: hypothetical protein WBB22_07955 [Anaerolineae bacterium]
MTMPVGQAGGERGPAHVKGSLGVAAVRMKTITRVVWHLLRHLTATLVCILALAALPIAGVLTLTGLAIVMIIFFFIGGTMDAGFLIAFLGNGMLFLGVVLLAIALILVTLLLATAFSVACVLPVTAAAEYSCSRRSVRSLGVRLGSFVFAGLALAVAVAGGAGLMFGLRGSDIHPVALITFPWVVIVTCVATVFLFGLILTTMTLARDQVASLWARIWDWEREQEHVPGGQLGAAEEVS